MNFFHRTKIYLMLLVMFCLSGCTEEKAKALLLVAESFKNEADMSCTLAANSITASVAMQPRTRMQISKSIAEVKDFNDAILDTIASDSQIANEGLRSSYDALNKICSAQKQLAAIYTDLPRGYLFSTIDVKKAQQHVVNVVMRFAKLAKNLAANPNIGKNNIARIKIIEARTKAMAVADEKLRMSLLESVADDIQANQANEAQNKTQLITQFAKTVALGDKLARASIEYDKLSVSDLIQSLKEFSSLYGNISGRTEVAQNALERINNIENQIKSDPVLTPLLDADLSK